MSTLTLTLDDDLLAQAEAYAQRTGTDVPALIEHLLRPVLKAEQVRRDLPPELAELFGCITLPDDFDYKEALADAITDRRHQ